RDLLTTARRADLLLGLDERLSTALEDAATPPARPTPSLLTLRDAQLDDTLRSVAGARPERDLSVKLNWRRLLPAGALLVALFAVIVVPDFVTAALDKATPAQVATEQKNIDILKQAVEAQPRAAQN